MKSLGTMLIVLAQCSLVLGGCGNHDARTEARVAARAPQPLITAPPGLSVSHDLQRGKQIFNRDCLACHGDRHSGAPQLGSAADWQPRLQQPLDTLIQHALHGHGRMPPKGGFASLTDADTAAAVAYVVSRSERIVAAQQRQQQALDCPARQDCDALHADELLTLQMLWLLGNPNAR